jgi:endonuclease YncB( thermonuclease family)
MFRYLAATTTYMFIASLTAQADSASRPFTGTVEEVLEGDVLRIDRNGQSTDIRLFGVDSPDEGQDHFEDARAFTRELVAEHELVFEPQGTDLADRLVCDVVLPDGRSLNRELVRAGWAWRYKAHDKDNLVMTRLTVEAMEAKRGLWALPAPLAPWDHRGESLFDVTFLPFGPSPALIEAPTATIDGARTIDLSDTDYGAVEKSVTIEPDGSRRLVLKGNHKRSAADVAFIQSNQQQLSETLARRAEEKRASNQAYQERIQQRIEINQEVSESRRYSPRYSGYGFTGPVIISGTRGFPSAVILPPRFVGTTPPNRNDAPYPYTAPSADDLPYPYAREF